MKSHFKPMLCLSLALLMVNACAPDGTELSPTAADFQPQTNSYQGDLEQLSVTGAANNAESPTSLTQTEDDFMTQARRRGRIIRRPPPPPPPPPPTSPSEEPAPQPSSEPSNDPVPAPPNSPIPPPAVDPAQAQIALGAKLFFEPRLSGNNQMSCATCHDPAKGFSNGLSVAQGINGEFGNRNTPTIYETHAQTLTFWDGRAESLEEQALGPIENPIEMNDTLENVIQELSADGEYLAAFNAAFNRAPNAQDLARAIASFERALRVQPNRVAQFRAGNGAALTAQEIRGMNIFFNPANACASCHSGPSFSDQQFHNIGVDIGPNGDQGRFDVTGINQDRGRFKTPTLINIARTGPYMHNGSFSSLGAVVSHYNRGGTPNPNQDRRIRPLGLNIGQQADLVAFLEALSSEDNLAQLRGAQN